MLPANVLDLASAHRLRQQQLAALATREIGKLWRAVDGSDPTGSWAAVAPRALSLMAAAQAEAVRGAQQYVTAAVGMQGSSSNPAGTVGSSAFIGIASDGRPLDSLLGYPAFEASAFIDEAMPAPQGLAITGRHLDRIVATQVQDAARAATGVAIVNDRGADGYLRALDTVTCSRCVVLAGRWNVWNAGFARHPFCSCTAIATVAHEAPPSAKTLFDAMTAAQLAQARWSKADIDSINSGESVAGATDTPSGLRSVTIAGYPQTTPRRAARRGNVGQRPGATSGPTIRPTPEYLYAEANRLGWSRDETIAELKSRNFIL